MHYVRVTPPTPPPPPTTAIFRTLKISRALYKVYNMGLRYIKESMVLGLFSNYFLSAKVDGSESDLHHSGIFFFGGLIRYTYTSILQSWHCVHLMLFKATDFVQRF